MSFSNINRYHPQGKKVYYINGEKFLNSKDKRDGKQKAIDYCLNNFIDTNSIITFDSQLECERYCYLKELENQGLISDLGVHFLLKVQESFVNANGDTIPPITYNADFIYFDKQTNKRVVEDVKGASLFDDTRFLIEKQLFDHNFKDKGLYIKVVLYRNKKWVEWKIGEDKKPQKMIKKQSEKIKELQQNQHEKEMLSNKIDRYKKRYYVLIAKEKTTKREKERLNEIKSFLVSVGCML